MTMVRARVLSREDLLVEVGEESFVQALDDCGNLVFINHKRQVDFRSSLGDHADLDIGKLAENVASDAGYFAQIFSHQTYDGFPTLVLHISKAGEVGGESRNGFIRINSQRDTDFRRRDDIHGNAMAIEGVKNGFQEAVRQQHAWRCYVNNGDALLRRDGFEKVLTMGSAGGDARAFAGGVARVQDVNRNVLLDCRKHGGWVQNFGAEISKLSGFIKTNDLDAAGVRAEVWIGGHHAIHVGPDFDFFCTQRGADDGCGKIRSPASDGCGDAISRRSNKSAHYRHSFLFQQGLNCFA